MKIKVNQTETYEIEIPEEVTMEQFSGLQQRFNHICKALSKDTFGVMLSVSKTPEIRGPRGPYKTRKIMHPLSERPWCKDREEMIKLLKILYHGDDQAKQEYAKSVNRTWVDVTKAIPTYRKRWDIRPDEVGLIRFSYKGETKESRESLKIKINEDNEK